MKPCISSEHDSGTSLMAAVAAGHELTLLPSCVSGTAWPRLKLLKLRPALRPWSIVASGAKTLRQNRCELSSPPLLPSQLKTGLLFDSAFNDRPVRRQAVSLSGKTK
jgi:hypothetical protein